MAELDAASAYINFNDENNTSLLDGVMRKLREAKDAPKKFYSSYPKTWGSLDDSKKRKVKEYWLSLPVPFRQGILESLKEERSLEPSASVRQLQTTKNAIVSFVEPPDMHENMWKMRFALQPAITTIPQQSCLRNALVQSTK